jgi:hypothetical protein
MTRRRAVRPGRLVDSFRSPVFFGLCIFSRAMTDRICKDLPVRVAAAVIPFLLAACVAAPPAPPTQSILPFSTDGCSLFPDRAMLGKADWCHCCLEHDLAYWRGGTVDERLKADQQLQACVLQASGNPALADLMFAGVRSGGGPYFYTPYRWAYGWPFGRNYEALSADEQAAAALLERQYLAINPALACSN